MTCKLGRIGALGALAATLGFGLSMLLPSGVNWSYFTSLIIAWCVVTLMAAVAAAATEERKAAGYAALSFGCMYAAVISLVYFAQLSTVRMGGLTAQAERLLDFQQFGLFFAYDMLGYAFLSLATFFAGFAIAPRDGGDRALQWLLWIHGIFAISCIALPMLGLFSADMPGGDWIGIGVLEFWCLYFAPTCILLARFFRRQERDVCHKAA